MYNEEYMENNMYVVAMPYPNHIDLPDILEEDNGILTISPNGGFQGFIKKLQYFNRRLKLSEIK